MYPWGFLYIVVSATEDDFVFWDRIGSFLGLECLQVGIYRALSETRMPYCRRSVDFVFYAYFFSIQLIRRFRDIEFFWYFRNAFIPDSLCFVNRNIFRFYWGIFSALCSLPIFFGFMVFLQKHGKKNSKLLPLSTSEQCLTVL